MASQTANDSSLPQSVWCHICNCIQEATLNAESQELECTQCSNSFVEITGQGVESFLSLPQQRVYEPSVSIPRQNTDMHSNTLGIRHLAGGSQTSNETIQRILNRVLGMNVQTGPSQQSTLLNVVQGMASDSGQPVEIVVRQTVSTPQPSLIVSNTRGSDMFNRSNSTRISPYRRSPDAPPPARRQSIINLLDSLLGINQAGRETSHSELEQILHHILMNEQSRAGVPPASEVAINSLIRKTVASNDDLGECNISFEPFVEGDICVSLMCGHSYKEDQIVKWLRMHGTCPVCRISILDTSSDCTSAPEPSV